jgi:hypothetical protein
LATGAQFGKIADEGARFWIMKSPLADERNEPLVAAGSELAVFDPTDVAFVVVRMTECPVSASTNSWVVPVGELNGRDVEGFTKLRKRSIVWASLLSFRNQRLSLSQRRCLRQIDLRPI